jgi:hypothetical protein
LPNSKELSELEERELVIKYNNKAKKEVIAQLRDKVDGIKDIFAGENWIAYEVNGTYFLMLLKAPSNNKDQGKIFMFGIDHNMFLMLKGIDPAKEKLFEKEDRLQRFLEKSKDKGRML